MTNKSRLTALLAAATLGLAAAPAYATDENCTSAPQAQWRTMADATAALTAQGYEVAKIEIEHSCYEAYTRNKDGQRIKIYLDPMTLKTVRTENKS